MKNYETLTRQYDSLCTLKHEHRITVTFNVKNETFTIDKEHPATQEEWDETEKDIAKILRERNCEFSDCDKKVKREELAGFSHDWDKSWEIEKPICEKCWKESKEWIKSKFEYFISLNDYLTMEGLIGNEENKNCPALPNYPKTGKEKDSIFTKFDLKQIAKFKEEINTKALIEKEKLYGNLTDQQKFFILEYLCYERNNYLREEKKYKEFQSVIETLREIYRNEQKIS